MKKLQLPFLLMFLSVFSCDDSSLENHKNKEMKPNFVFLFADDQTFETIGELGFKEV